MVFCPEYLIQFIEVINGSSHLHHVTYVGVLCYLIREVNTYNIEGHAMQGKMIMKLIMEG